MYNPSYTREENKEEVLQFMKEHPFVFLAGCGADHKPAVTQVPVFIDEREGKYYLTGHIMRNSDHHKAFLQNPQVLAVFTGPHTYVSATWYDNPHQASTWNYVSVHARGEIRFGNKEDLIDILKRLTLHYEKDNPGSATVYDNLPDGYTEPLLKAIVAFEVEVSALDSIFKLSQNRNEKSYTNIIHELSQQEGDGKKIAEMMQSRKAKLFPG